MEYGEPAAQHPRQRTVVAVVALVAGRQPEETIRAVGKDVNLPNWSHLFIRGMKIQIELQFNLNFLV